MKIQQIKRQQRRDFIAVYVCEHCNATQESSGYDDAHFHANVIPSMECANCDKSSPTSYVPRGTKYAEHEQL